MDLKNFVPSADNVEVELKINDKNLKNQDGSNMTITTLSPYSKKYKEIIQKLSNERIKKSKGKELDSSDYEDFALEVLTETTVDWDITWDGKKPEFDKKLAKEIYDSAFWIKALINQEQAKLVHFTIPRSMIW